MTTYVALLRAVNLGSRKKLPMADLRKLLDRRRIRRRPDLPAERQRGVHRGQTRASRSPPTSRSGSPRLGLTTEVILRTADELGKVIDRNPMEVGDPAKYTVLFLLRPPAPDWLDGVDLGEFAPEEMRASERELYLNLPNGIGRAKLPVVLGRRLKVPATMRNWRTVTNLMSLAV